MSALSRFESFMEGMVEGNVARLFRSPIQPAEIGKRLERAMEGQQTISVDRIIVPNDYKAHLHPDDFAAFAPVRQNLQSEMARYLTELARERGFSMLNHPAVELVSDPAVKQRSIMVVAQMSEAPAHLGGHTQMMSVDSGPRAVANQPKATLILYTDQGEHRIPLTASVTNIGRGLNNDLILEDSRVSREHAQLRYRARRFWVSDLRSTNGTFVNGDPVQERDLRHGDIVSLGGLELRFEEA
jgi:hypothetical protein